jgi:hypothetical protein
MEGKGLDPDDVILAYWKRLMAQGSDTIRDVLRRWERQLQLAKSEFDDDLPDAGDREKDLVVGLPEDPELASSGAPARGDTRASNGYRRAVSRPPFKGFQEIFGERAVEVVGDPSLAGIHSDRAKAAVHRPIRSGKNDDLCRPHGEILREGNLDTTALRDYDFDLDRRFHEPASSNVVRNLV